MYFNAFIHSNLEEKKPKRKKTDRQLCFASIFVGVANTFFALVVRHDSLFDDVAPSARAFHSLSKQTTTLVTPCYKYSFQIWRYIYVYIYMTLTQKVQVANSTECIDVFAHVSALQCCSASTHCSYVRLSHTLRAGLFRPFSSSPSYPCSTGVFSSMSSLVLQPGGGKLLPLHRILPSWPGPRGGKGNDRAVELERKA